MNPTLLSALTGSRKAPGAARSHQREASPMADSHGAGFCQPIHEAVRKYNPKNATDAPIPITSGRWIEITVDKTHPYSAIRNLTSTLEEPQRTRSKTGQLRSFQPATPRKVQQNLNHCLFRNPALSTQMRSPLRPSAISSAGSRGNFFNVGEPINLRAMPRTGVQKAYLKAMPKSYA